MKRLLGLAGLALASILGSLAFTAPAHATVSCNTTTTGGYPDNRYYYCGSTSGYNSAAQSAFSRVGGTSGTQNAKTVLNTANHKFYLFATYNDYNDYCTASGGALECNGNVASNRGYTWKNGSLWTTIVIENQQGSSSPTIISNRITNTMAHEIGHHLDYEYRGVSGMGTTDFASETGLGKLFDDKQLFDFSRADNDNNTKCGTNDIYTNAYGEDGKYICSSKHTATVGGSGSAGNQITITVTDPSLPLNGATHTRSVTCTVTTATTSGVATCIAAAINTDTGVGSLAASGITATSSSNVVTLKSASGYETTYTRTISGGSWSVTIPGSYSYGTGDTLAADYSGLTNNSAIIKQAFPTFFFPESYLSGTRWAELFAEETATEFSSSESGAGTPDRYITRWFTCTGAIVEKLAKDGVVPSSYPSGCN